MLFTSRRIRNTKRLSLKPELKKVGPNRMPSERRRREGSRMKKVIEKRGAVKREATKTIKFQRIRKNHQRVTRTQAKTLAEKIDLRSQREMTLLGEMSHPKEMNLQKERKMNPKKETMKASLTLDTKREIERMRENLVKTKKITVLDPEISTAPVETIIKEMMLTEEMKKITGRIEEIEMIIKEMIVEERITGERTTRALTTRIGSLQLPPNLENN